MSLKSLAASRSAAILSALPLRSPLRIAVPAWRSAAIETTALRAAEPPTLSREEIQTLFHGELADRVRRRSGLTAREEQERSLARRIRSALYPPPAAPVIRH